MASARPSRSSRSAVPMASEPAAQAVAGAAEGPRRPRLRAAAAHGAFERESGIASGLTRSAPRSARTRCASRRVSGPPCTLPIDAPVRSWLTSVSPASSIARAAATDAKRPARSIRRASFWPKRSRASSVSSATGKAVISPIPFDVDAACAGAALGQGVPEGLHPGTQRTHDARAGHHHTSRHRAILAIGWGECPDPPFQIWESGGAEWPGAALSTTCPARSRRRRPARPRR